MDLPPSSLLGRLEAFLPEMEKANQTTEKLAQQGKLEVLDSNLEVAGTDQQREVEEEEEADGDDAAEGVEQEEDGAEPGAGPPTRTVQLVSAGICVFIVYLHVARGMKYKRVQHGAKCCSNASTQGGSALPLYCCVSSSGLCPWRLRRHPDSQNGTGEGGCEWSSRGGRNRHRRGAGGRGGRQGGGFIACCA